MTQNLKSHWFLIGAEGGMMPTARLEITARGVDLLLPMSWRRALVDGHHRAVPSPRLPGNYAFVLLTKDTSDPRNELLNEQAAAVKALRGVREVYRNARGQYSAVPNWEIQALKDADAEEYREACKVRPKFAEQRFKAGTSVRIVRHATAEGHVGEFLFSVRGHATLSMGNGIKMSVPDCDIVQITKGDAVRLAG